MRRSLIIGLVLTATGCASSPRKIAIEVDSQLASGATLWIYEIFSGFPLVSFHMTDRLDTRPGASIHLMEACLPAHVGGLELTSDNADGSVGRTLHYKVKILPRPETGAVPQDKHAGVAGIIYYEPPANPELEAKAEQDVVRFKRAVAQADSRKALGCWGGKIYDAMERADQ